MFSTIYVNHGEVVSVDGLSIAKAYTEIMLGRDVVVTVRDNSAYGIDSIGVMVENFVFRAYWGETFCNFLKKHID